MFKSVLFFTYAVLLSSSVCGQKNPYSVINAESYDHNKGAVMLTKPSIIMAKIAPGDVLGYYNLNFSDGALAVQMYITSNVFRRDNCSVLFRLDSETSAPFLTYYIEPTGSWDRWVTATTFIPSSQRPQGVHNLYLTFEPPTYKRDIVYIDWFIFYAVEGVCPTKPQCTTQLTTDCPETEPVTCPSSPPADCPTPEPVTCPNATVLPCVTPAPTSPTTMTSCNCLKYQKNSSKTLKSSIIITLIALIMIITFN